MKHWNNTPPGDAPAPAWAAAFFSGRDYARFLELVEADLRRRGHTFEIDDGVVILTSEDGSNRLGLQNLAQQCGASGGAFVWAGIIKSHFDKVVSSKSEMDALTDRMASLDAIRGSVKLRLYPRSMFQDVPAEQLVTWPIADDLLAVLVLDLPDTVVTIDATSRGKWDVGDDALLALAYENVAAQDPVPGESLAIGEAEAIFFEGGSFFVASHLGRVAQLAGRTPKGGFLCAIPTRHVLIAVPLDHIAGLGAVERLLPQVSERCQRGPGSISDQLYWVDGGQVQRLVITQQGNKIQIQPPPALVERLGALIG